MRAGGADGRNRRRGARAEQCVCGDEGAVEIGRERLDLAREARRELDQGYGVPPVAFTTYAATLAICWVVSWLLNDGIAFLPLVTRAVARR